MGFPTRLENTEMNVLTFSEARASLKQAMDKVCDDHQPTVITRQRGEHVVRVYKPKPPKILIS